MTAPPGKTHLPVGASRQASKSKAEDKAGKGKALTVDDIRFGTSLTCKRQKTSDDRERADTAGTSKSKADDKAGKGKGKVKGKVKGKGKSKQPTVAKRQKTSDDQERAKKFIENGCSKCRWKPGCTPSCWSSRNMQMPTTA